MLFCFWVSAPAIRGAATACDLVNGAVGSLLNNPNSLVLNLNCAIPAGAGEYRVQGTATILGAAGIGIEVVILREGTTPRLRSFVASGFPSGFSADSLINQLARLLPGGSTFRAGAFTPSSLPLPRFQSLRMDFGAGNVLESMSAGFAANTWPLGALQVEEPRLDIGFTRSAGPEALLSGRFLPAPGIRNLLGIGAALDVTARFSNNPNAAVLSASLGTSLTISSAARLTNLRLNVRPLDRSLSLGATLEAQVETGKPVLKFAGDLGLALAPVGPEVSGTLELSAIGNQSGANLAWDQPFGIPGVTVRNLKFGLGVAFPPGAPPAPSRLELAGDGLLGTTAARMSGAIGLGLDATDPLNNYLVYTATSPVTIAAFIRAFSTASLPAEVEQGLGAGIQNLNATVSPRPLSVGGQSIPPGVHLAGDASFFGKSVAVDLAANQGAVAMSMSDIEVSAEGIRILKIGGAGGKPLTFRFDAGADSNPPKPGLRLDGSVTVLGVTREATVNITSRNFEAQLGGQVDVLKTSLSGSLRVTAQNFTGFDVPQDYTATFDVSLGTLQAELRDLINSQVESAIGIPLGNLFTDLLTLEGLSISTKLGLQQLGGSAAIRGRFLGQSFDESFGIDLNLTDVASLFAEFIERKVVTAIEKAGGQIEEFFVNGYAQATRFFGDVLNEVEAWFDSLLNDPKVTSPSDGQQPPDAVLPDNVFKFEVSATVAAARLDGEDGVLEVFGQITCETVGDVWANKGANAFLFSRRSGNAVDNPPDGHQPVTAATAPIGIRKTLYVSAAARPTARLRIHVRLRDFDPTIFDTDDNFTALDLDVPLQLYYTESYQRTISTGGGEDLRLTFTVKQDKRWGSRNGAPIRFGDKFYMRGLSDSSTATDAWISGQRLPIENGEGRALVRDLNAHSDRSLNSGLYVWTLYDGNGEVPNRELQYGDLINLSQDQPISGEHRWLRGYLGPVAKQVRTSPTRDGHFEDWRPASRIGEFVAGPVRYGDPIALLTREQFLSPTSFHYLNWGLNSIFSGSTPIGQLMGIGPEEAGTAADYYAVVNRPSPVTNYFDLSGSSRVVWEKVVLPPNRSPVLNVEWAGLPAEANFGDTLAALPITASDADGFIKSVVLQATQLGEDGLPARVIKLAEASPISSSTSQSLSPGTAAQLGAGLFSFQVQVVDDRGKTVSVNAPRIVRIHTGLSPSALAGIYERTPVLNDWHRGTIAVVGGRLLRWVNSANVSWDLIWDPNTTMLETGPDNPYFPQPNGKTFNIQFDDQGQIQGFTFQDELYRRIGAPPAIGLNRTDYPGLPGTVLDDFYPSPRGRGQFPHGAATPPLPPVLGFETPVDSLEKTGVILHGYLVPPVTGSYIFYLSSDDQGELWLSTSASPADSVLIAREPEWNPARTWTGADRRPLIDSRPSNVSPPIQLNAGQHYYVEAMMKEGSGEDYLGVAWKMPDGPTPFLGSPPIPGLYLRTAIGALPQFPPLLRIRKSGGSFRLEWAASNGAILESARAIEGPWAVSSFTQIVVQGQTAYAVNTTSDSSTFFRLRRP